MNNYLFRSLMFVPGHNEKLINSAIKSEADVLLLDIEDSVQPESNKEIARTTILRYIQEKAFVGKKVFPRVNDRESGQLLKDISLLAVDGVEGFMYPKSKSGKDVYFFDKLLETIEYEKGFPLGTFKIIPLIETTGAVVNVDDICKSSSRVVGIAFGAEDYLGDLQGCHDSGGMSLFTARSMIAIAARANEIIPIDTVHIKVHDLEDLEKNIVTAKGLGFEGMLVLHPKELKLVHKYYSPTEEEYKDAKEVVALSKVAYEEGRGVAILNGKFIGPPLIIQAKKIINKYELINK